MRDYTLAGFSMGGGEVARYFGKFGSEGVDLELFQGIEKAIVADRYAFLTEFFKIFYNADVLGGTCISDQALQASWNVAIGASATATFECVYTWYSDFRKDLLRVDVPMLVLHGDADRILPITATGMRTAKLIKNAKLVVIKGATHGMLWTHGDEVNAALQEFLQ